MLIGEDRQEVFSTCGHPPLRHLRASIFPTFQQERTFVTPAVWNSLFPLTNLPSKIANHKNNIFLPESSNLNPTLWKSSVSSPVSSSRILTRKRNICRRHFLFSPALKLPLFSKQKRGQVNPSLIFRTFETFQNIETCRPAPSLVPILDHTAMFLLRK